MKCNWCGKGKGKNFTRDKDDNIFYYYCEQCVLPIVLFKEQEEDDLRISDCPVLDRKNTIQLKKSLKKMRKEKMGFERKNDLEISTNNLEQLHQWMRGWFIELERLIRELKKDPKTSDSRIVKHCRLCDGIPVWKDDLCIDCYDKKEDVSRTWEECYKYVFSNPELKEIQCLGYGPGCGCKNYEKCEKKEQEEDDDK